MNLEKVFLSTKCPKNWYYDFLNEMIRIIIQKLPLNKTYWDMHSDGIKNVRAYKDSVFQKQSQETSLKE